MEAATETHKASGNGSGSAEKTVLQRLSERAIEILAEEDDLAKAQSAMQRAIDADPEGPALANARLAAAIIHDVGWRARRRIEAECGGEGWQPAPGYGAAAAAARAGRTSPLDWPIPHFPNVALRDATAAILIESARLSEGNAAGEARNAKFCRTVAAVITKRKGKTAGACLTEKEAAKMMQAIRV